MTKEFPPTTVAYRLPAGSEHATPLACMKMLPDGAPVYVHEKIVSGITNGYVYIEEPDRSAGIRITAKDFFPPVTLARGNLITVWGVMGTDDAERVIYPTSEFVTDMGASVRVGAMSLASPGISGWPMDLERPDGPRYTALLPIGLSVQVWGKVTAKDEADEEGMWYVYLDDGWGRLDGNTSGYRGVRVYCDRVPLPEERFQVATGVCATKVYDPTPFDKSVDDTFVIPVVRCTTYEDLYSPQAYPESYHTGSVTGHVRAVGQTAPGIDVRVYTQSGSRIVHNVTDAGVEYTLDNVTSRGAKIAASAAGYVSSTRDAYAGDTGVDLTLEKSGSYIEVFSDRKTLRTCSTDRALVTVMLRDCEGKGLSGSVRLSTTRGSFESSGARDVVLATDNGGFAEAYLNTMPDGAGTAVVRAEGYSEPATSGTLEMEFLGAAIAVSADTSQMSQPGTSAIRAHLVDGSNPIVNAAVVFSTDLGAFQQSGSKTCAVYTDQQGNASAILALTTPGTAKVTASYENQCGHQTVAWVVVAYNQAPWYDKAVQYSNPLVADLDGSPDGRKEVAVVTYAGMLTVLDASGNVKWEVAVHPPGSNTPSCLPMDADRSGLPCIFLPSESQTKMYAFAHDGRPLAGWPAGSNYRFIKIAASIADMNLDGTPEIVAGDECCYVFSWNPTGDWRNTGTADSSYLWRNLTGTPSTAIYGSTCALGDLDGDPLGIPDLIVGTNRAPEVYAFPGDPWGDFISAPLYLNSWPKSSHSRAETSPAIGDMDGDGKNDAVLGADDGNVYIWLSSDGSWTGHQIGGLITSSPALCDLDDDGKLDVVVGSSTGRVFALNWQGIPVDGWEGGVRLNWQSERQIESSPVIGDVTGDGQINVVIGSSDGNVYALYKDGINHVDQSGKMTGPVAWVRSCTPPGQPTAQIFTAPVIDDVDNDGKVEVVAAGDRGIYLIQLDVPYVQDPVMHPWPTFHHDNQRTGCVTPFGAPIRASIHGIVTKDGAPLSRAKVYIYHEDGSPVMYPFVTPATPRDFVYTVGSTDPTEAGKGAYCISQLEPSATYKLKVVVSGLADTWVTVPVTTGATRIDIAL